jgi:tetratricopeptide (TPR) repeat protein
MENRKSKMINPDKFYFSSDEYRNLLDELGENIAAEDHAEKAGNSIEASDCGLMVWNNLLEIMKMLQANSIYELDRASATIYDLLYWATCFADELHNASLIDKAFEEKKLNFCKMYTEMHQDMLDKDVRNLGNIRISLADSYCGMGETEKADALFRKWLDTEPDWGWGWIGWSDYYWMWEFTNVEKDVEKAEKILIEGLSHPNVVGKRELKQRLKDLRKKHNTNDDVT